MQELNNFNQNKDMKNNDMKNNEADIAAELVGGYTAHEETVEVQEDNDSNILPTGEEEVMTEEELFNLQFTYGEKDAMNLICNNAIEAYAEMSKWIRVCLGGVNGFIKVDGNVPDIDSFLRKEVWITHFDSLGAIEQGKSSVLLSKFYAQNTPEYMVIVDENGKYGVDHQKKVVNLCTYAKEKPIEGDIGDPKVGREILGVFFAMLPITQEERLVLAAWIGVTVTTNWPNRIVLVLQGFQGSGKSTIKEILRGLTNGSVGEFDPNARFSGHLIGKRVFSLEEGSGDVLTKQEWNKIKAIAGASTMTIEKKGMDIIQVKQSPSIIFTTNADNPIPENDGKKGGNNRVLPIAFGDRSTMTHTVEQFNEYRDLIFKHKNDVLAYLSNLLILLRIREPAHFINYIEKYESPVIEEMRESAISTPEQMIKEILEEGGIFKTEGCEMKPSHVIKDRYNIEESWSFTVIYKTLCGRDYTWLRGLKPTTIKRYISNAAKRLGYKEFIDRNDARLLLK